MTCLKCDSHFCDKVSCSYPQSKKKKKRLKTSGLSLSSISCFQLSLTSSQTVQSHWAVVSSAVLCQVFLSLSLFTLVSSPPLFFFPKGMVKNEKGQGWKKRGDGWLGHPFLKAWSSQASQAVKFTLLILCNNLRQRGRKKQRCV